MKFAYFCYPHVGGTFEVFRHLAEGLQLWGIDVRWVGLGPDARRAFADPRWQAERARGIAVGGLADSDAAAGRLLARELVDGGFDGVFVNVLADAVQTNVARYLPREIIRILIVHNITPATYDAARAVREYAHGTVAISPRIREDLLQKRGFSPNRVHLIPHATALPGDSGRGDDFKDGPLRLLFLGRIEDKAKGVLALPDILRRLSPEVTLSVAGEGPDLVKLKHRCRSLGDRVRFLGAVDHSEVLGLLDRHDIMVMPSRFEGFGLTLIEAMAAGCVPVATRIRGVTDWLVRDGESGFLFGMADCGEAAARISHLDRDRELLRSMSHAGRRVMAEGFDRASMACRYAALIERLTASPPRIAVPLDLGSWEMPSGLRDHLRTHCPAPVKNLLRRIRENAPAWRRSA